MIAGYDLYSEFDIQKHKENYVNYLEVVIDSDGKVMYAVPSHQEKLIAMLMQKNNWCREEVQRACPREYWFDFVWWLCRELNAVSVWNEGLIFAKINRKQYLALRKLKLHGLYRGVLPQSGEERGA